MRGTARRHGFLNIGAHLVAKAWQRRAWPHGADSPHFHMHKGKISQFFEVWVFPANNVGLCVDGPHKPAEHLQNTPGTPAMHIPLAASSFQSTLYPFLCPYPFYPVLAHMPYPVQIHAHVRANAMPCYPAMDHQILYIYIIELLWSTASFALAVRDDKGICDGILLAR